MTYAKYARRAYVHSTRHGNRKTQGANVHIVLHTSEGGESSSSAEALAGFLGTPATATNVASYHDIIDTDQVIPAVTHGTVAYAAGGGNARGIHACFPGKAGQTREQWLDTNSRAMIRTAAGYILDVCDEIGITGVPVRLEVREVANYERGLCDHDDISKAFKKSNHWDVGPDFPWDVLYLDMWALRYPTPDPTPTPTPGDDLMITVFQPTDCLAEFIGVCDANGNALEIEWIQTAKDQRRRDAHIAAGARIDRGPATKGRFVNCNLSGPVPFGDSYRWSPLDFHRVIA